MTININEIPRGGTCMLCKAGLTVGGTSTKARMDNPDSSAFITFAINGITYSVADADNTITLSGDTQAADTTCLYLVCLATAGTGTVVKGVEVSTAALAAGTAQLHFPAPTVNTCPAGAIRVETTAAFIPGTTALDAGTVTDTYYDFFCIPVSPLTS